MNTEIRDSQEVVQEQIDVRGMFVDDVQQDDLERLDELEAEIVRMRRRNKAMATGARRLKADFKASKGVVADIKNTLGAEVKNRVAFFKRERRNMRREMKELRAQKHTRRAEAFRLQWRRDMAALKEETQEMRVRVRALKERLAMKGFRGNV